ncbi:MAG: hypothetical protein IT218_02265 [Ignavibacteria bacterium]|nr:hypothetical protein [Candidatus Kapabacteria bacterium]MCC6330770.1 hypothetical protein [Ignavibacteria bacterium]MCL4278008.1 hypothetical protein [Ignavibacteria bacterium]NOG68255.1 hypothetical protein [Chlorobiota bacterium]QOJ25887.1 MAG: hypothetical protein HRU79_04180 [Ignavibacteria bacterium]
MDAATGQTEVMDNILYPLTVDRQASNPTMERPAKPPTITGKQRGTAI